MAKLATCQEGGSRLMGKHIVLTTTGLVLGLLLLAWIRPDTSAGSSLLMLLTIFAVNAIGVLTLKRQARSNKKHISKHTSVAGQKRRKRNAEDDRTRGNG